MKKPPKIQLFFAWLVIVASTLPAMKSDLLRLMDAKRMAQSAGTEQTESTEAETLKEMTEASVCRRRRCVARSLHFVSPVILRVSPPAPRLAANVALLTTSVFVQIDQPMLV